MHLLQQQLANDELKTLEILMEDLEAYFRKDDEKELVNAFKSNTQRYVTIFEDIVDRILPIRNIAYRSENVNIVWFRKLS